MFQALGTKPATENRQLPSPFPVSTLTMTGQGGPRAPVSTLPGMENYQVPQVTTGGSGTGNNRGSGNRQNTMLPQGTALENTSGTYQDTTTGVQNTSGTGTVQSDPYNADALNRLLSEALTAYNGTSRTPYGGDFFAGPTGQQTQGLNELYGLSDTIGSGATPVRDYANDLISGRYLSHESNPYIAGATEAALRPIQERYFNELMPALEDASIAGGAYGGASQQLLKDQLASSYAREAGDLSTGIYFRNYENERGRQQTAPEYFAAADEMDLLGPQLRLTAGGMQQEFDQTGLNNALAKFSEKGEAPWRGMEQLMAALNMMTPYGKTTSEQAGTSTTTSSSTGTTQGTGAVNEYRPRGGLAGGAQGALGGAGMGLRAGSMVGHPIIGALLGGLLGGIGGARG